MRQSCGGLSGEASEDLRWAWGRGDTWGGREEEPRDADGGLSQSRAVRTSWRLCPSHVTDE